MSEPRIAVVISAYNYGHYLAGCLESILGQTRPPDDILVVDDGSTDATPEVLAAYDGRVRMLKTMNAGQAAAFNRGTVETDADLVLFLDADDLLLEHAVETVLTHWAGDMAHLVFGLETIDADGRSLGRHPGLSVAPEPDNRHLLLRTGAFPCPPTSGNVFSRALLDAALPIPEARWRISADCYLTRAAALFGRTGHVARVLAQYRLHFGNNYARVGTGAGDEGLRLQNRLDVADALEDLSRAGDALLGAQPSALRRALRDRAHAIRAEARGETASELRAAPELLRSRLLPILPLGRRIDLSGPVRGGLLGPREAGLVEIDLRLPQTNGPLSLHLSVAAGAGPLGLSLDGATAVRLGPDETEAVVSISRAPFAADRIVRLALQSDANLPPQLLSLALTDGREARHAPYIGDDVVVPAAALATGLDPTAWTTGEDGAITLVAAAGELRFTGPPRARAVLSLGLGARPPEGWLTIDAPDAPAFRGRVGRAARLDLPLLMPVTGETKLRIEMRPDDGASRLRIETVRLSVEPPADRDRPVRVPISVGERVRFDAHPYAGAILVEGWAFNGETAPVVVEPEARLAFDVPLASEDLTIVLDLEPLVPPMAEDAFLLAVSRDGEVLAQARVEGEGELVVALGPAPPNGRLDLALHAVAAEEGADEPWPAPIALRALRLDGALKEAARPPPARRDRPPPLRGALDRAGAALDASGTPDCAQELARCRVDLARLIAGSDVALPLLLAGGEARLAELVAFAEGAREVLPTHEEEALLRAFDPVRSDADALRHALLHLLVVPAWRHPFGGDLSRLPPPLLASPESVAAYLGQPPHLASGKDHAGYRRWLETLYASIDAALAGGPITGRLYSLASATLTALRTVRTIFADGNLRDLCRRSAQAIERRLAAEGASLSVPFGARPGLTKLRLGVLTRDIGPTPEGWALRGMYEGLDGARFEPVLIRVDDAGEQAPEVFAETLSLAGLSVGEAVRAIRALNLDVFVTGAYARDFEKVTAIYAHRLAPLQVWHAAVCPTTGGFSSFDVALSCRASEPARTAAHYTERLGWIEGERQCAYAFDEGPPVDRAAARAELGLGGDTVALVSTAMAHKIDDALLARWAEILTAAPEAVLVLAPFASNWSMAYAREAFEARLLAAGLSPDRTRVLPTIPPDRLRAVLVAVDLMLDSFPYSGATTVCEALSVGTPVVARAGRALRQLTGASWVRAYGLSDLVAGTAAAYVEIATALATDRDRLADARARTAAAAAMDPPPHDDRQGFGRAYSDALWRAAEESARFPGLAPPVKRGFLPSSSPGPAPAVFRGAPTRTFAILASPRTGSTLLCAVLNRTPGVLCHFELFHEKMIQYAGGTMTDEDDIAARDADPAAFLDRVRREAGEANVVLVGFKHFAHQAEAVADYVAADPSIRVIHLSRANLLAQFSSEQIARASDLWVQHQAREASDIRIGFDIETFENFERYQRRIEAERIWRLARSGRSALFVEYSCLGEAETRARIGEHLGITIPDMAQPDVMKQNRPDIARRFSNPETVLDYLARRGLRRWAVEF